MPVKSWRKFYNNFDLFLRVLIFCLLKKDIANIRILIHNAIIEREYSLKQGELMGITAAIEHLISVLRGQELSAEERLGFERRLIALILKGEERLIM